MPETDPNNKNSGSISAKSLEFKEYNGGGGGSQPVTLFLYNILMKKIAIIHLLSFSYLKHFRHGL